MTLPKKELDCLKVMVKAVQEHGGVVEQKLLSGDSLNAIKEHKLDVADAVDFLGKAKQVVGKFFSIDENWSWKRNLLGAFLVYCPEIPAYFIPSYTQAKNTGCAKDLKHGEGVRGLITGGLEGLAVGAIVSGKEMSFKKIAPFFALGAILQFGSSLVLPKIGEKVGTFVHNKRKYAEKLEEIIDIPFGSDPTTAQLQTAQKPQVPIQLSAPQRPQSPQKPQATQAPNANQPQFKGVMPYNQFNRGSLKV